MKIAYIHSDKKIGTGSHYINDLIVSKLREHGVEVQSFYPQLSLTETPIHFKGINNILFFYSLLEKHVKILKCDIIQGTTYTPLAFMHFAKPVVSHFGSTTIGFLKSVPSMKYLEKECADIYHTLKKDGIITEVSLKTKRPLHDIATIEHYAAQKADYVIATSEIVRSDLVESGIDPSKIEVIYNAIEDYWFSTIPQTFNLTPSLIFLGRIGDDAFTLKLKGLDRFILLFQKFPNTPKRSIVMSHNKKLISWLEEHIPNHSVESNIIKTEIPQKLAGYNGSILLVTSRYEGFSLSLIEGMSQGIIPISFPVGVAPEIIRNGENGYIVTSLAQAEERIKNLLEDTDLRKKLSLAAKNSAQDFRSEVLALKMMDLYGRIEKKK